jgi:serine/threonine-protein kinase
VRVALQIARALGFAHEHGLVHRDVKPQNVLLNGDAEAKVTDFGIARSQDVHAGLTQTGTVMGTSDYISPEQARGSRVDAQSDVYSLGAVLYEMLTGEVPFPGDNFVSVALRHINEPVPSVRARRSDIPPRLDAAVQRAMAKDPRDRFGSMDELCAELSASLDESDTTPWGAETMVVAPRRRLRRARRAPRASSERPSVWPLIVLLAGLAVLAGILAAVFTFTDSTSTFKDSASKAGVGGSTSAKAVRLSGVTSYDPEGDNQAEHSEDALLATDRDPGTYWTTEHYSGGLNKSGVGVVLDADDRDERHHRLQGADPGRLVVDGALHARLQFPDRGRSDGLQAGRQPRAVLPRLDHEPWPEQLRAREQGHGEGPLVLET